MQAFDYYQKYIAAPRGSETATRRATAQDISNARTDKGVDFHIEQATAKE
jgi:hypothetical protein